MMSAGGWDIVVTTEICEAPYHGGEALDATHLTMFGRHVIGRYLCQERALVVFGCWVRVP